MDRRRLNSIAMSLALLGLARPVLAQPMDSMGSMSMPGMEAFGPIPDAREASGTSWQPDATPMRAHHFMAGDWQLMAHYNAFFAYDHQSGPRGADQFNSVNWLMAMATRRADENEFMLRGMFSLEPWTVTKRGYPLLFQSGEAYHGQALVDRQHPHDFFMELATRYRRILDPNTVISLYAAPSGEPALGPTAFPHRVSAMENPAAPITHHWLDSTHISFGVLTLGVAQKQWQLEGSWFNGREPDENRWNIERPKLNSFSGRFTWNFDSEWSAQVSSGYLKSPEELHPDENVRRTTASITHAHALGPDQHVALTLGWGLNHTNHEDSNAYLAEASWQENSVTVFGRAEHVQKTGEELALSPGHKKWNIQQVSLGASYRLVTGEPWELSLGGVVTYSFAPDELDQTYGDHPVGYWIFAQLRPEAMRMNH